MKRIVEIVPARPGWYARWRNGADSTCSYPVTVWALVEDSEPGSREVIGIDSIGQWPGADGSEDGVVFVRYLFHPPGEGRPEDAEPEPEREAAGRVASGPVQATAG
ncbi:hypothetical protein [Plantactinospora sp. KBS50]|uniref:hypothetical protein n=1 Tax=Plantactinospora sp. KBS50 TaxID=2024580 RepID=UPI000BAAFBB5|nr:hypothetical protein [Plantactinospora sp. KBS50]ASW54995.1 hypothetical protein CIK06_13545 [Plantactinospora sp. KBS50]